MKPIALIAIGMVALGLTLWRFFPTVSTPDTAPESRNEQSLSQENTGMVSDHSGTSFSELSVPTDCSNECVAFPKSSDQYAYCRSVCGLSPVESEMPVVPQSPTNPSLERMIQQKETAVQKSDLALCQTIADENLRTACVVRVTEDLLE